MRANANFNEQWSGNIEYYHVLEQDKVSIHEDTTPNYDMLNLVFDYELVAPKGNEYRIYLKGNNLLNQKVYAHESFLPTIPQVGRNFTLGINIGF